MAKQLVSPDFSTIENAGWCLQYARRVFGAPAVESTAWQGWMMTEHPHEDRNFPEGVAVPVWFDWKGDVGDGHIFRYGHVAVKDKNGVIWSSPLSGRGSARFNSVDDLTRAFGNGMRYVGWSEDISDVKVIEIGEDMAEKVNKNTARMIAYAFWGTDGRDGRANARTGGRDADLEKFHIGQDLTNELVLKAFDAIEANSYRATLDGVYAERDRLRKELKDLKATLTTQTVPAVVLKPGKYEVK